MNEQEQDQHFKEITTELWNRGELSYIYRHNQESMRMMFDMTNGSFRKFVLCAGRGCMKSSWLLMMAYEYAIKYQGCDIFYIAPVERKLEDYISPIVDFVLKDCPLREAYRPDSNNIAYIGKSRILFRGSNNKSFNDLRGGKCKLALVDEAGYVDDLVELVDKVLMPACLKEEGGRCILSSTPPESPAHPFESYCQEAEAEGYYFHMSFREAGYSEQVIQDAIKEAGGEDSITWKVEYEAIRGITNTERAIIPEYNESIIKEVQRPKVWQYIDSYEVMDSGGVDNTVILFSWYHPKSKQLIIEDEIFIPGTEVVPSLIAKKLLEKETSLHYMKPKRFCDHNDRINTNALAKEHKLTFIPAKKGGLKPMIQKVREWVKSSRILINPRCTNLIEDVQSGTWDKNRKGFSRNTKGHNDALAALVMTLWNISEVNRVPSDIDFETAQTVEKKVVPSNLRDIIKAHRTMNAEKRGPTEIFGCKPISDGLSFKPRYNNE